MNERDLLLYERIKKVVGSPPQPGPVVLDVKTTQFVRVELVVLKALTESGRSGLFVSVDRPHQYMVHLLDMHRIDHQKVTFVDAVARFSADRKQAIAKVEFLRGPSHIDTLPDVIMDWASNGKGFDLDDCGFAMIDNISTLLNFNNQNVVEVFLSKFFNVLAKKVTIPVVVDRDRNPHLYETVTSLGGRKIDLGLAEPGKAAGGGCL